MNSVTKKKKIMDSDSSNLDLIESNLWLGNLTAATNTEILSQKKINFILTVNSFPLPKKFSDLNFINVKYIKVFDTPRDDILSHFEETYDFIEHAIKKGVILVHCVVQAINKKNYHGISRSAAIIVAFLMKKKNMTLKAALGYVKSKRDSVEPNVGFLEQLKLYETMCCTLNINNIQYKMFRLHVSADHVKNSNALPKVYANVIKPDPFLITLNFDYTVYKCKKCRRTVALHSNLIPHLPKKKFNWINNMCGEFSTIIDLCDRIYFIEPLAWMKNIFVTLEGKLLCPNTTCKNKLGSYSWVSGCQCPCGAQICPGFFLCPSKVDKQN